MDANGAATPTQSKKPFYRLLYVQVLFAIALGVAVGLAFPGFATTPGVAALGTGFIKLIKMVIAPIIFCTVVSGIAHIQDAQKLGRSASRRWSISRSSPASRSSSASSIGNVLKPGAGFAGKADAAAGREIRQCAAQKRGRFRPRHHPG